MTLKKSGLALLLVLGFQIVSNQSAWAGPRTTTTSTTAPVPRVLSAEENYCVSLLCAAIPGPTCVAAMSALPTVNLLALCVTVTTPIVTVEEEVSDGSTSGSVK